MRRLINSSKYFVLLSFPFIKNSEGIFKMLNNLGWIITEVITFQLWR